MGEGHDPYRQARIVGALGMLLLVSILMLYDAASTDFRVDTLQLGLLLGSSLGMLAVDGFRSFLK